MALRKRPSRRSPTASSLTPAEARLVDFIAGVLRVKTRLISTDTIVDAITTSDPTAIEEILQQAGVAVVQARLVDALQASYRSQSINSLRDVLTRGAGYPGLSLPRSSGIRLQSGIIVPSSLAPDLISADLNPAQRAVLDYINPRSADYAVMRGGQLVTDISEANRRGLRWILTDSMAKGRGSLDTARMIQKTIGLHTRWARAVVNYDTRTYTQLVSQGMRPAAARERTDVLTKRYRDKLIRARAVMIARTETQLAQNMARQTGWDAASKVGVLDGSSMKEWRTAPSGSSLGRPCDVCAGLNKTRVQWNAAFPTGHIMPPAHPHCRCTAVLVPPSRGLTGLPSQDMDSWIAALDAMDVAA